MAIFALFRPQELEWLPAAIVDLKTRRIHIPREQSLDGRSIILSEIGSDGELPCLPPVLFDWLEKYPFTPQPWQPIKRHLANALGSWIPHGCRHTGIANCAAAYGNMAAAMLMTREKYSGQINGRPLGIVSPSEAKRFYALTPDTVITAR